MNMENTLPTLIYRGHDNIVHAVAWSPDGAHIASSASARALNVERLVHVWKPESGELLYMCAAGSNGDNPAWSPDGALLASGGWETVHLWESGTGRHVRAYPTPLGFIHDLAWSPTGDRLALAGDAQEESGPEGYALSINVVIDTRTGAVLTRYDGHTGLWNQGIAWSPDGTRLASAGYSDKTVQIWDAATGATFARVALGEQDGHDRDKVMMVAWSPDGRWVASGVVWSPVRLHDAATGAIEQIWSDAFDPSDLAWSPDGRWLAVGSYEEAAQVFDVTTGSLQDSYAKFEPRGKGKVFGVTALAWAPDGARLALGSYDGTVHVWRPRLTLPSNDAVAE